jgi:tetratricopeptide (TPR) repeat protein
MLALTKSQGGQFEEALRYDLKAYAMAPRQPLYAGAVMTDFIQLDRFAEAKAVADEHFRRGFDNTQVHRHLLMIAYAEGDWENAANQIAWFRGRPDEYVGLEDQAAYARMSGRLQRSQELLRDAATLAGRRGVAAAAIQLLAPQAENDALLGRCAASRETRSISPAAIALCGDSETLARAEQYVEQTSKERPTDTFWNLGRLPLIRSAMEFRRGRPDKSVELLRSTTPYERAIPFAIYLRGLAYLRLGQGQEAAAEFQKIANHRGSNWGPMYPLSYLGVARGAAASGDAGRARKAYQEFLSLCEDADPDVAVLVQARKEYSSLSR